jgi:hypothetical protein
MACFPGDDARFPALAANGKGASEQLIRAIEGFLKQLLSNLRERIAGLERDFKS